MPTAHTAHFGVIEYSAADVIQFPEGLPAFEDQTEFLAIERAASAPVVFLQSLREDRLVFITLPALDVDADYRLAISPEDLAALELDPTRQPHPGSEVAALAIVTIQATGGATANLMAPVVINQATRRARQVLQPCAGYSHQHPLAGAGGAGPCS